MTNMMMCRTTLSKERGSMCSRKYEVLVSNAHHTIAHAMLNSLRSHWLFSGNCSGQCISVPELLNSIVGFLLATIIFHAAYTYAGLIMTPTPLMAAILLMMGMLLCSVALILFSISKLVVTR